MKNILLVAFNGEMMCFIHVLLNALDMHEKGWNVKILLEGSATGLIPDLEKPDGEFSGLYKQTKDSGIISCVCKACSSKMGVLNAVEEAGLPLCAEMKGHPSLGRYMAEGYEIITF
jgi:hypothetical protein